MTKAELKERLFELTEEEQLEIQDEMLDRLVPIAEWHREIIRERIASYDENPDSWLPWDEVRARIEERLRARREA